MESDARLVARSQSGDESAFAELVCRHREMVFCLAVSVLGSEFVPEAEDVAQDVFLKVHRSLGSFRGESEFRSWIYRVTYNQALNAKSRLRSRRTKADETALLGAASVTPGPDQQAEAAERDRTLAESIQKLPEVYQSALRLYYWLDVGVADVGVLLGVPENTAKSYLHRARQLLNGMLKERGYSSV